MRSLIACNRSRIGSRHQGFTLVELLVVVSILALLVAILLPSLGKARDAAYTAKCLGNMRQLTLAGIMYWPDNRDYCVPIVKDPANYNAYTGVIIPGARWSEWVDRTYDYLRTRTAYSCPTQVAVGGPQTSANSVAMLMSCYVYKNDASSAGVTSGPLLKSGDFGSPSSKVYFADSGYFPAYYGDTPREKFSPYMTFDGQSAGGSWVNANRTTPSTRHNTKPGRVDLPAQGPSSPAGFNAGFFDGHAKYMDWQSTFPMVAFGGSASAANKAKRNTYWLP